VRAELRNSNKLLACKNFSTRQSFCPRFFPLSCWAGGAAPKPGVRARPAKFCLAASSSRRFVELPVFCCNPVQDQLAAIRTQYSGSGAQCRSKLLRPGSDQSATYLDDGRANRLHACRGNRPAAVARRDFARMQSLLPSRLTTAVHLVKTVPIRYREIVASSAQYTKENSNP
jgi:hypothetical protein